MLTPSDAAEFSRWFLAVFFVLVAVFYTARILLVRRRTGRSPVGLGERFSYHWWIYALFRVFRVLILAVCVGRLIWPPLDRLLVPIAPLWSGPIMVAGDLVLLLSFLAVLAVHVYMAGDWRSGIDPAPGPRRLVTGGPYALTRNPMALMIQLGQVGLFLALPTLFTLLCLIVGVAAVQAHVRLEEAELLARHGPAYLAYRAAVPRWLVSR